jgi:hypothetical protein
MTFAIPRSKDFWAGVTFIALAALALYFGAGLSLGTARRMGPGYFPTIASGFLIVIGAVLAFKGLSREAERVEAGAVRPALILVSVLLFGLLLPKFGLVAAVVALIAVSSFSLSTVRLVETVLLAALLTVFAWAVFVWGLGLPLKTWPV